MDYTYKEIIEKTYKALDFIDLTKYLKKDLKLNIIMSQIENDCCLYKLPIECHKYINNNLDFFENNDIFNWITDYEFLKYCEEKYPNYKWEETTITYYWIKEVLPNVVDE